MITKHKTWRRGFTMIELLLVISIIGILAAIVFPVFGKAKAKANRAVCASNLKQLAAALSMYSSDYSGRYPSVYAGKFSGGYNYDSPSVLTSAHERFCRTSYLKGNDRGWSDVVSSHLKSPETTLCPSRGEWPGYPRSSYELKLWFVFNTKQDMVSYPASVALLWETWAYHHKWEPETDLRAVMNVAFVDGHVEYKRLKDALVKFPDGAELHGYSSKDKTTLLPSPYQREDF